MADAPAPPRIELAQLYTPAQVAAALGLSPRRIRQLVKDGRIGAINTGLGEKQGRYRISAQDVQAYIAAHRIQP